jgi:DnaJ domain
MKSPETDWYAVLGVGRGASSAQIARAFRKAAFRWHPDRNAKTPELAHQQFLLVHHAYEVLSDPLRRSVFDSRRWPMTGFAADVEVDEEAAEAPPPARRRPPAPAPPQERRPFAFAPDPKPKPRVSAFGSRVSWFVLSLLIRTVGFIAMVVIGPFAEQRSRNDFHRRAPAFVEMIFPLGRIALIAALVLAIIWAWREGRMSLTPAIVFAAIGAVIFLIERIAVASVWAMGQGRRRTTRRD